MQISVAVAASLLWAFSLWLPAFTGRGDAVSTGLEVLQTGFLGLLQFQPAWLANLVLPICVYSLLVPRKPWLISALLLMGLSSCSFFFSYYWTDIGQVDVHWRAGFYVWNAANFLTGIFIVLDANQRKRTVAAS